MSTASLSYPVKNSEALQKKAESEEKTMGDRVNQIRTGAFVDITRDPEFWKKAVLS